MSGPLSKFYVTAKIPWYVRKVSSIESACNIAVREASKVLPDYVDIDVSFRFCPSCGAGEREVLLVGSDALVALLVGAKVVAKDEEGAARVMKSILRKVDGRVEVVRVARIARGAGGLREERAATE